MDYVFRGLAHPNSLRYQLYPLAIARAPDTYNLMYFCLLAAPGGKGSFIS